jgi:hypothetical protein
LPKVFARSNPNQTPGRVDTMYEKQLPIILHIVLTGLAFTIVNSTFLQVKNIARMR